MSAASQQTYVIVGGGLAAATAVQTLRGNDFGGRIVLFGAEMHLPYERPPLSKGYLMGNDEIGSVFTHPIEWYAEHEVDLRLGTQVAGIDPRRQTVIADDREQQYDALLLATGASPRRLPLADGSGAPVTYLRTIEDSQRIKAAMTSSSRLVIIGGGWIGLEVAAAARGAGAHVTVVERLALPLMPVLGERVARVFASLHGEHGVDLRVETGVSSISGNQDGAAEVRLHDGSSLPADLVVIGVGVLPNVALAEAAGLATDNGVVTDQLLCTSDPHIFAAGDVANAHHPVLGRRIRVEHWDNAIGQGETAARNMLGHNVAYDRLPYFFTDQYDLGMEYVGSIGPEGYDEVVLRGAAEERQFSAFWVRDGRVLAGMHANDWDQIDPIRTIVTGGAGVEGLRDESSTLTEIAARLP